MFPALEGKSLLALLLQVALLSLAGPLLAAQLWIIVGMFRTPGASATKGAASRATAANEQAPYDEGRPALGKWPSVSVIIPAHNEARRLPATLASLGRVEYPGAWEVVLVDDRSSDATPAVMQEAALVDSRITVITITEASKRLAPKVNAVRAGILASSGAVIVTSDADCSYRPGWLVAMVSAFEPGVAMVSGYVETNLAQLTGPETIGPETIGPARVPWWARVEAADWFSLMLVSRSMLRFGKAYASSANNQAYLRSAFDRAGGFGAGARAPSGDEDLLAQRLGALPGMKVAFADDVAARVSTRSAGSFLAFLKQRSRWVSRYRHMVHYRPAFLAGLSVLGFESIALGCALLAAPFVHEIRFVTLIVYLSQTAAHVFGMNVGARQLGRPDLGGFVSLVWALLHPFIIATAVIWSWLAPGDWRAGAVGYRRSLMRRRWRLLLRSLVPRGDIDV
ncbi:MAG TPA: glycosyltransferase [Trueperaceae bacterium]|nr:glycosyltransferase [Trueperaceae bacterium]